MKKFEIKSFILGLIIGTIGISTVFAANGIKSATYSQSKVYFHGKEIPLKNSLVSIVKEGSSNSQLYMPVRELLEYMNFNVEWKNSDSSVNLTMSGFQNNSVPSNISKNEADKNALEIMQKTGNWSYIEPYLEYMTNEGIDAVVTSYNSKHMNKSEHKKASDYYK